jgi:succinate dehydrogenase / fumarate reductase cytochrome b subunit
MNSRALTYLNSSVGKKQVMGVTGLLLCGFTLSHLIGNLLMMVSPEAFNKYAHALISNPLIYVAEAGLGALFLIHLGLAINLTMGNRSARPSRYAMRVDTGRGASIASSSMPYTGMIILIFLITHIQSFKFGPVYMTSYDGVEIRDLYRTVVEYLANPLAALWYIVAMVSLATHVSHGFWSAFQSLGFNHPGYNCMLKGISKLFSVVVSLGFITLTIYCYLQGTR